MPLKVAIRRKAAAQPLGREEDAELYPDSDGLPMAQNDYEHRTICHAAEALRDHLRDRPDMHDGGDIEESQRDRRAAERELDSERQGRIALEAENAELRARLEALDAPGQQPGRP